MSGDNTEDVTAVSMFVLLEPVTWEDYHVLDTSSCVETKHQFFPPKPPKPLNPDDHAVCRAPLPEYPVDESETIVIPDEVVDFAIKRDAVKTLKSISVDVAILVGSYERVTRLLHESRNIEEDITRLCGDYAKLLAMVSAQGRMIKMLGSMVKK